MNTHLTDDQLHQYVDRELDPPARETCARHLESCPECAGRLTAVDALMARVEDLPATVEPPEDLWPALRHRIESRKVVSLDPPALPVPSWRSWWTRPGFAAAAAALLVLATATATAWLLRPDGPSVRPGIGAIPASLPANTPREVALLITDYEGMTQRLAEDFAAKRALLPAEAVLIVEENLRVIDEALGELRAVLLDDPENETLIRLLTTTYRQKVSVLEHATESVS